MLPENIHKPGLMLNASFLCNSDCYELVVPQNMSWAVPEATPNTDVRHEGVCGMHARKESTSAMTSKCDPKQSEAGARQLTCFSDGPLVEVISVSAKSTMGVSYGDTLHALTS